MSRYSTPEINAPVALYNGPIRVQLLGQEWEGPGNLTLSWTPEPDVRFEFSIGLPIPEGTTLEPTAIRLTDLDVEVDAELTGYTISLTRAENPTTLRGRVNALTLGEAGEISALDFHLPNFPGYLGEPTALGQEGFSRGRCTLESAAWRVVLDQVLDFTSLLRDLRGRGGYAITHVGRITKKDDQPFGLDEGYDVLEGLHLFLSFLRTRWTAPVLVSAQDDQQHLLREDWTLNWRLHPWSSRDASRTRMPPTQMSDFFAGFMDCWQQEVLSEAMDLGIRAFVDAAAQESPRMGLLIAQTGLEVVAWAVLADQDLLKDSYSRVSAADRIRLLLQFSSASPQLPPELEILHATPLTKGADGPEAITKLRNRATHPRSDPPGSVISEAAYAEATSLSLAYLERLLIALIVSYGDGGMDEADEGVEPTNP